MKNKTRQIISPRKRPQPDLDPTENRLRAMYGEMRDKRVVELHQMLESLSQPKVAPAMLALFAQEMGDIFKRRDGETLRQLASMVEAPIARPAEEIAYGIEANLRARFEGMKADMGLKRAKVAFLARTPKRVAIVESIMEQAKCDKRTAERAIEKTKLRELLGWKAGRPQGS
jgi:hypothetical protein